MPAASDEAEVPPSGPVSDDSDFRGVSPDAIDATRPPVTMTEEQLTYYARRPGVPYPTVNGADLYRICALIPKAQRDSFENGLGNAVSAYYNEVARLGREPSEPAPDPVESFVRSGLLSEQELFAGYEQAREVGQAMEFLAALKQRNDTAAEVLLAWIDGKRGNATAYVPRFA